MKPKIRAGKRFVADPRDPTDFKRVRPSIQKLFRALRDGR